MPGSDFAAGLGLPDLDKYETTEEKLAAIKSSLYMLLENLQYTLRHLDSTNFNGEAMEKWLAGTIEANDIITKSLISDEIYSDYGEIADLTAARLRTDYYKAQRYLDDNTEPIDYIKIEEETVSFVTGSVRYLDQGRTTPDEEQLESSSGEPYYWRDTRQTQMTCRKKTSWPVWVYGYDELTKGQIHFETVEHDVEGETVTDRLPVIELGAGSDPAPGHEEYGKARIIKDLDGLYIRYVTGTGREMAVTMTDSDEIKVKVYGDSESPGSDIRVTANGAFYNGADAGDEIATKGEIEYLQDQITEIYEELHPSNNNPGGGT